MRSKNEQNHHDVIVIGSGVSGLMAAKHLQENAPDLRILVVEANDRIGGRTYTHVEEDHRIDLGATWVHGSRKHGQPIAVLAAALNIKLVSDHSDRFEEDVVFDLDNGGKPIPRRLQNKAEEKMEANVEKAKKYAVMMEKKHDKYISIQEALNHVDPSARNDTLHQYFVRQHIEFDYGGPATTISGTNFDHDKEYKGGDFIPLPGYKPIVDSLAQGLDIELGVQVQTVQYDTEGVKLHTNRGAYYADKVICTIPLGVLKSGAVKFEPELSEFKQRSIERLGWGTVNKVGMLFENVFWPKKSAGFGIVGQDPMCQYILNKYAFNQTPMLEAYIVGEHARDMAEQSDEEVLDRVLSEMSIAFGRTKTALQDSIVKTYIKRWSNDEFAKGAYSYAAPRTVEDHYKAFHRSQLKVVYFAGEHTIEQYRGTVHGAYLSGRRAANDVLESMRRK
jgi:monoamine oxidase